MVQALHSEAKSIYGNPWREDQWNLTLQGKFVTRYGLAKAEEFAKLAGTKVGAGPKKPIRPIIQNFLFNKTIVEETSGARGYSGDGVPTDD